MNGPTVSSCQGAETHGVGKDDQVQIPETLGLRPREYQHSLWMEGTRCLEGGGAAPRLLIGVVWGLNKD